MPADEIPAANSLFVASIAKGFRVLECVARADSPLTIAEIATRTGFDRSLVQRLTNTLHALGYLARDARDRRYELAIALLDFSYRFLCSHPLLESAMPRLVGLSEEIGSRVAFGLHDGTDIVYVFRVPRSLFYHPTSHFGERQPVYSTAGGRAVIAYLPEREARAILEKSDRRPITPYTRTGIDEIMSDLAEIRRRGCAVQHQEFIVGETVVAAPVRDQSNRPVAVVACSLLHERDSTNVERIETPLLQTVDQISRVAGGRATLSG